MKIIIIGDAGRGKTTFAKNLSQRCNIPLHSTDDFLWHKKFTVYANVSKSIEKIKKVYGEHTWIVEGSTRHLITPGLNYATTIYHLTYSSFFSQVNTLFRRYLTRDYETFRNFSDLVIHVFKKRYNIGSNKKKIPIVKLLEPYKQKVVRLTSFSEIERVLGRLPQPTGQPRVEYLNM